MVCTVIRNVNLPGNFRKWNLVSGNVVMWNRCRNLDIRLFSDFIVSEF